jgi:dolichyl-phosphate-mannose-protein mannosyltransferase
MAVRGRAVTAVGAERRARVISIPAWVWLTGIVVLSAAIRIALGRRMVAPWIMIDEIVYSSLAKSFAAHGSFLIRGVPSHGYGFVYPVLIAPAFRLFSSVPDAYAAVKAINAVLMSLTAVPAYFLARRVLRPGLALVVAALTVAVPSMLYTGTVMTENVFYPLFVLAALALVTTLERPTPLRQVALLAACALAFLARQQAVALFAAAATAPIVDTLFARRGVRTLGRYATLYGILGAGAAVALLGTVARGRSVYSLLGAYRAATTESYSVGTILHYLLWHVGELDLYLGIVPFAALLALWLAPRRASPAATAFAAASLSLVAWLVLEVAAFASQQSERIEERNMFYVAPLALTAMLGLAADGVITRRRRVLVASAAVAAVLPVFVPYARFITTSAVSDTFALLPWWWVQDQGIHLDRIRWAVLAVSTAAALLFLFVPRRLVLVLPALVGAYYVATAFVVDNGRHGIHLASVGSLWAGIRVTHPDWIDRAVGRDASVDYVWSGTAREYSIWENEFFNRSLRRVDNLAGPSADPLPQVAVSRRPDGRLVAGDRVVRARYVLADGSTDIAGRVVAADPRIGLRLYRVNGPVVLLSHVTGLYPNDTWSGRTATYERVDCGGGRLSVLLGSDPSLYRADQVVTARVGGRVVGRVSIPPTAQRRLTVPLRPSGGTCRAVFTVGRTKAPGRGDPRPLGAHFLAFTYRR